MPFVQLLPILLSLLLLFGHGFRELGFSVLPFLGILVLLLVPSRAVARFFQVVLCLGALEWARLGIFLSIERERRGEPWIRMAMILGATFLLTLWAVVHFESTPLRRFYARRSGS